MFHFGSGTFWGVPISGNLAANPTPMKFATLQDVSLDISGSLKELFGQKQFPEAVARGKVKITGKAKWANINGKLINDLFFGQTLNPATGIKQTVIDEVGSVSAGSYTVVQTANFFQDLGVRYSATGLPLTLVPSAPAVGQYTVTGAGVYGFNVGDNGTNNIQVSYNYTVSSQGMTIHAINQLMGFAPTFKAFLNNTYSNKQQGILLYSCVASKLSMATKQEDFLIPELDFEAFADASGNVIDMYEWE